MTPTKKQQENFEQTTTQQIGNALEERQKRSKEDLFEILDGEFLTIEQASQIVKKFDQIKVGKEIKIQMPDRELLILTKDNENGRTCGHVVEAFRPYLVKNNPNEDENNTPKSYIPNSDVITFLQENTTKEEMTKQKQESKEDDEFLTLEQARAKIKNFASMKIGENIRIKMPNGDIIDLSKYSATGRICHLNQVTEFTQYIDKDHAIRDEYDNESHISHVRHEDLLKFLGIEETNTIKDKEETTVDDTVAETPTVVEEWQPTETEETEVKEEEPKTKEEDINKDKEIKDEEELMATISDTTQITRAIAQREAGEKLRKIYGKTSRYKPRSRPTKMVLFLGRGYMKDHYTKKYMKIKNGMQRDENIVKWADRHAMEFAEKFNENIKQEGLISQENYPRTREKIDEIAKKLTGNAPDREQNINENLFQEQFTAIIRRNLDTNKPASAIEPPQWKPLAEIIKDNDIVQMGSNITQKLTAFRDHQKLVQNIMGRLWESDDEFDKNCRQDILAYYKKYQENPKFLKDLHIKFDDKNAIKEIKNNMSHRATLTKIAAKTMKLKIQILTKGEEAYTVKQELTGMRGALTKAGNRLDKPISEDNKFGKWLTKHPFAKNAFGGLRGITKLWVMITPAMLLAPVGPLAVAAGAGTMAFAKTLLSKHAHYNKEHIGYQRNQATNLTLNTQERNKLMEEISKMNGFKRAMLYYFGMGKQASNVRQFRDYVMTTHDQLENTNTLGHNIENLLEQPTLDRKQQEELEKQISRALARLDHHKKTGQNFLGSDNKDIAEKEYQNIYRLTLTGAMRLDKDLTTIRDNNYYDNELDLIENGTGDNADQIGYKKSRKRFKHRQTEKALIGATKAGGIAFGLSYLASSLASHKGSTDTLTEKQNLKDSFVLGKHDLTDNNNIYTTSKEFFQNPDAANQTITFQYGGGTDATGVIPWHLGQTEYINKFNEVQQNISQMSNLSSQTKSNIINEIQRKPRENVRAQKWFSNDYLQWMRCIEWLEQTAKALNESGVNASNITLNSVYNGSAYDIVGQTYNNAGERIIQWSIEYSNTTTQAADTTAIPVTWFGNTFQERYQENSNDKQPSTDKKTTKKTDDKQQ